MSKWLFKFTLNIELPLMLKALLNTMQNKAERQECDSLGIVEIQDGNRRFVLLSKSDFDSWFGGNEDD